MSGMAFCLVSETPLVSFSDLVLIATAIQTAAVDFCEAWGIKTPSIHAVASVEASHVDASHVIMRLVDASSADGALGYHTEEDGVVYAEVAAGDTIRSGGGVLENGSYMSVSSVVSHEVFETLLNPNVNVWVDRGDGHIEDAREACDAVQGSCFDVAVKARKSTRHVSISNYLLPAWFDAQSKSVFFDKMGLCKKPFEVLADGYHIIRKTGVEHSENGPIAAFKLEIVGNEAGATKALKKRRPAILHGALSRPSLR